MRPGDLAVRRPVMMLMLMALVLLLGTVSLRQLSLELLPRFETPVLAVYTTWGDASPREVSVMITEPLERVMATISGLSNLTSISSEGRSVIVCEFSWGTNLEAARDEIRERVGLIPLPENAARPLLLRYDPTSMPGMRISVSGDMGLEELARVILEVVAPSLESVPGVAVAEVGGLPDNEIRVTLKRERMLAFGLSQQQVVQALRGGQVAIPAGAVREGEKEYNVRVLAELNTLEDIQGIIVGGGPQGSMTLGQIAEVSEGRAKGDSIIRTNGKPGVTIAVRKEGDANLVQVNRRVVDKLAELEKEMEGVELTVTMNQARFIEQAIGSIGENLLVGAGLAVLVLLVSLGSILSTAVIAVAIPFSVVAAFVLMHFTGLTLNIMSLGGLALGVGMLVDNSIVVIENIYRHLQNGAPAHEAAARGTNEVTGAITASTFTTLAVFLPVIFVGGMTGELFRELALTVSFSLLASLIVAVTVIPMLASRALRLVGNKFIRQPRARRGHYTNFLGWVLKRRFLALLAAAGLILAGLLPLRTLGREFLPGIDEGNFVVTITMPVGTSLERTADVAQEVEGLLQGHSDVAVYSTRVGGGGRADAARGKNAASVDVRLVPEEERSQTTAGFMTWLRRELEKIAPEQGQISVQSRGGFSEMAGSGTFQVDVRGPQAKRVMELAAELRDRIAGVDGLADVQSNMDDFLPEQRVVLDRERVAAVGMVPFQVAVQASGAVTGMLATQLNREGQRINVVVEYPEADVATPQDLRQILIALPRGTVMPLSALSRIQAGEGPVSIYRQQQQVTARVTAVIEDGNLGVISQQVHQLITEMDLPSGYQANISGAGMLMEEGFSSLYFALALAVALVYMIMAGLFESLIQPLIIIISLPLAAVGALWALSLGGFALGITAMIGVIMLTGIVVNNSIVLVDVINQLRWEGKLVQEAIITGSALRLRPILMTAATTMLAMLPLALGIGEGSELQAPLAAVVIGGLLTSTILTLFVTPVLYSLVASRKY
jgi:HAE1 family hydrophobic/amphiphilic exporter-1